MNPIDLTAARRIRSDDDWIARARGLVPLLDGASARIEAAGALTPDVLAALHEARMFRMLLPRALDGAELDLATFFRVASTIAEGDASTAWCLVQSSGCALSAAYLEPRTAQEVFGAPDAMLAWGFPSAECRAVPVDGGWTVDGSWSFGSGNRHARWVGGHCRVCDADGRPLSSPGGKPVERTMLLPRASVTVDQMGWNVVGLRGTGSDSYSVKGMFVPAALSLVVRATGRDQHLAAGETGEPESERREHGTLYRFAPTSVYQCGFAGVALGIAQATLNSLVDLATKKAPSGGRMLMRDNHVIQARIARSEARLCASRAWLTEVLRDMWAACAASGPVGFEHRIRLRLAASHAFQEAREVLEHAYTDAGATAIFESNPFERRMRDMHAVCQQVQASPTHFESVGQHRMGLKPNLRFI